jgi:hypothetical protein
LGKPGPPDESKSWEFSALALLKWGVNCAISKYSFQYSGAVSTAIKEEID